MALLILSLALSRISLTQAFLPSPPSLTLPLPPPPSCHTTPSSSCLPTSPTNKRTIIASFKSSSTSLRMSFMADGSDYKADKSDFGDSTTNDDGTPSSPPSRGEDDMANVPVTEEIPVPMSRNNVGNRFLCLVYDRQFSQRYFDAEAEMGDVHDFDYEDDDEDDEEEGGGGGGKEESVLWEMHRDRIALTEDHVMWARKQNLYNDTFNTDSMADILWSHQLLSSDLQRTIGHAMVIDSPTIHHCREALSRDPIIQSLLGTNPQTGLTDVSSLPLYRWRHIRDHTLRRDDGRDGFPHMVLAFDRPEDKGGALRQEVFNRHLEYLIRGERTIAAGPLHVATEEKMDPESVPVGTLMLFNAKDREDAVEFVENDPAAMEGLYETMSVHRYNNLDVTGKFVSENLFEPNMNTYQMKEAMEYWGYPVEDHETKWLNW